MKQLVCKINDRLLPIHPVETEAWESFKPAYLVGVPAYSYAHPDGSLRLWPQPLPECQIYRLEEQSFYVEQK